MNRTTQERRQDALAGRFLVERTLGRGLDSPPVLDLPSGPRAFRLPHGAGGA